MTPQLPNHYLEVEHIGELTLAKITLREVLTDDTANAIGERLYRLAKQSTSPQIIVNLEAVQWFNSLLLAKFITLHRRVEDGGGRVAFCALQKELYEMVTTLKLGRLLHIYQSQQEATQSFHSISDKTGSATSE